MLVNLITLIAILKINNSKPEERSNEKPDFVYKTPSKIFNKKFLSENKDSSTIEEFVNLFLSLETITVDEEEL